MKDDMKEKASKAASERREITRHATIPQDIDFATLDDLDDIVAEQYTIVPVKGKSGKWHNWLMKQLSAGERASIDRTMFPKTVLNKAKNSVAKGQQVNIAAQLDATEMQAVAFRRDCLTIKKATVYPKGINTEDIEKLSTTDFDNLLEAANIDVDSDDEVARFPADNGRPEDEESSDDEV